MWYGAVWKFYPKLFLGLSSCFALCKDSCDIIVMVMRGSWPRLLVSTFSYVISFTRRVCLVVSQSACFFARGASVGVVNKLSSLIE